MIQKQLYFIIAIQCLVISCQSKKESESQTNITPNIIFIMSDDHSYKAISSYGYGLNQTPNIDRIANEGAIFTNGFVTNSICAPSRAVILTGKHSHINGKVDNLQRFDWNQDNFAKLLQKSGYQTALVGKIHMDGLPQGFDYSNVLPGQGHYYNPDFIENGVKKQVKGYVTNITTDIALDWLQNKRKKGQPFLLMYHQKAPHRNWMPEGKYLGLFDDVEFKLPDNFFDDYKGREAAALHEMGIFEHMDLVYDNKILSDGAHYETRLRKVYLNFYNRLDEKQKEVWDAHYVPIIESYKKAQLEGKDLANWKYQRYMRDYLATVQSVDDGVGTILDYLDANNLTENTIVVYTSDQGFYLGEHGWFDKRFMYEESFRTPILIKYPKEIKPGTIINEMVQNLDFAPTFLDYANITIPNDIQGESFRRLFSDEKADDWRDVIYYSFYEHPGEHNVNRHYGIRTKRYKIMHFYGALDQWELYDLEKDPNEMNNVYNDPDYSAIKKEMLEKLDNTRKKYKDSDENDKRFLNEFLESKSIKNNH